MHRELWVSDRREHLTCLQGSGKPPMGRSFQAGPLTPMDINGAGGGAMWGEGRGLRFRVSPTWI